MELVGKILQRRRQTDYSDMSRFCHDSGSRAIVERVQPETAPPIPVDLDAAHALGVTAPGATLHEQGETGRVFDLASVTKPHAPVTYKKITNHTKKKHNRKRWSP